MIDIFDIIENQKTIHIDIEGEVSSDGLFFDLEYINELTNLLLDNQQDVEFKIFNVKEYRDSEPVQIDRFGMYGTGFQHERSVSCIEFRIDVYITNKLNNKIEESMQDFIDFFTKGAVVYNKTDESIRDFVNYSAGSNTFTFDTQEEYMSTVFNEISPNISVLDYMFTWEEDNNEWGIGSHPQLRSYDEDADGDAIYAAEFRPVPDAESRPTDLSNMFRNL